MSILERARHNMNIVWLALACMVIAGALIVLPLTGALAVIGGALALIALVRLPELALYVAIFAVPFGSWFPLALGAGNLTAVDLAVAVLLALWLARMIAVDRAIVIHLPPLVLPLAVFLLVALCSMTVTLSLQASLKEFTKWVELLAMYVYVANHLDAAKIKRVLLVMFLAGIAEAGIGIYQFIFRVGPEGFALFGRFMRAYGTFEQPNPFAGYLGLIAPVALGVVMSQISNFKFSLSEFKLKELLTAWGLWLIAGFALLATLAAIVMSWSRGAWLGVGAGLIVTVIVQSRRAFIGSLVLAFVLTLALLLSSINLIPTAIADRFAGVADYFGVFDVRGVKVDDANFAIVERMAHWQAAEEMFIAHPVLGVGIGNYAEAYPVYALPHWSDPLGHAHNYYLNVAAETGILGLLAYLVVWGAAFWQSWRTVRRARGVWANVAAGLLGMLVMLAVHNGFDNLFVHGMAVQVGISLGIIAQLGDATIA